MNKKDKKNIGKFVKGKQIVVGLSGGVDSSMALVILRRQGWAPVGVSLRLPVWKNRANLLRENICCTKESLKTARRVCQKLGVKHYIFDVRADFQKKVIGYFVSELENNRTPNPCIVCNRYLKFKKLFEFAKKIGAEYVATGHYSRIATETKNQKPKTKNTNERSKTYYLLRGKDKEKDQSYALCFLSQKWLPYIVFPLGNYKKKQVYKMAKNEGFDFLLEKKQSQDFCFVAGKSLPIFLKEKIGEKPGGIVDTRGKVLGKHKGLHFYTIGQRKGLKLSGGPWFVKGFDTAENNLIVTKGQREVCQKEVILAPFNFISEGFKKRVKVMAKIRYRQALSKATLYPPKDNKLRLVFDKAQRAVTPGQFAVFYLPSEASAKLSQKGICLGGGRIMC